MSRNKASRQHDATTSRFLARTIIVLLNIMISTPVQSYEVAEFFKDSSTSVNYHFWMRDRHRAEIANGKQIAKQTNLDHASSYLSFGFNSGYIADRFGIDLNIYGTSGHWNKAGPDHEMNFWGVNNPYDQTPTHSSGCSKIASSAPQWEPACTSSGTAFQTAALKFKLGEPISARIGRFQPSVPSAIGVNWSFSAGTYTGGEVGIKHGSWHLGFVYANRYRAPWYEDRYGFRDSDNNDAGDAYSVGGVFRLSESASIDIAYSALTKGQRQNSHLKLKYHRENGWFFSPQLYLVKDELQYDNIAYQLALSSTKTSSQYNLRLESTYTYATSPKHRTDTANFTYRLTERFGASNGAYDIWWNNRSDFNHHNELGIFGQLSRDLSDVVTSGLRVGFNATYAFGAKARGYDDLKEYSGSVFANYLVQKGTLKNMQLSLYFTHYVNSTNAPNWTGYSNAFQDESDLKLIISMPLL